MYRADATVDIGQTKERGWFGREDSVRGEEVGEVRASMKHEAVSASSSDDQVKIQKTLTTCGGGLRIRRWLRASAEANADMWGCPKSSREQHRPATTCCTDDIFRKFRDEPRIRIKTTVYHSARS
jgi:hypothetical protein